MSNPEVRIFRETLIWPVKLDAVGSGGPMEAFERARELIEPGCNEQGCRRWQPHDPLVDEEPGISKAEKYSEFVYFHTFVQSFLYGPANKKRSGSRATSHYRVYRRNDIAAIRVLVFDGWEKIEFEATLDIERVRLYIFDAAIAILVVEMVHDPMAGSRPIAIKREGAPDELRNFLLLTNAQSLLDQVRRTYPPYWTPCGADHCLHKFEILDCHRQPIADSAESPDFGFSDPLGESILANEHQDYVRRNRHPPVMRHWRHLMHPLEPTPMAAEGTGVGYSHLLDERIPLMAYLAFDEPFLLTPADFARLCFADAGGDPGALPYSPRFLANFEENFCYDRFWSGKDSPDYGWLSTRYLCSGYAFVVVGKYDPGEFFVENAQKHFRTHYFQFGLVAHFQKAALLAIEDELSGVAEDIRGDAGSHYLKQVHGELQRIEEMFLRFTHRYWVAEVSNQVQARELFSLWVGHLGTKALYQQVSDKLRDLYGYMEARVAWRRAEAADRLANLAAYGVILGLPLAALAADPLVSAVKQLYCDPQSIRSTWPVFAWLAVAAALAFAPYWWLLRRSAKGRAGSKS